jgi:sugar lactone lactonase YvrE
MLGILNEMSFSVERGVDSRDRLGECPLWDERSRSLWWVDIHAPAIKRFDGRSTTVTPLPQYVGSIALRESGGLLAALQSGLYFFQDREIRFFCEAEKPANHRFNDGRCDPAGRFWVGTLKDPEFTPSGSLYCFAPDGCSRAWRHGIAVPNSLAWSPDGRTMYFADSPRHKIWAFDYDAAAGAMSNERLFAAPHPGFPDGSCVDAEGCLWNAEYGAARVVRYRPDGEIDRVIDVPPKEPTCCCFGGAQLDTLYITSANGEARFGG